MESAWLATQRAWPNLNTGPKLPDDFRAKLSVKWQNRWPDVLYHNAILQGALRSALLGREVEATVTATFRPPALLPKTRSALPLKSLSGTAGGGPLDWRAPAAAAAGAFLSHVSASGFEYGQMEMMREWTQAVHGSDAYVFGDAWARSGGLAAGVFGVGGRTSFEFYRNLREAGYGFAGAMGNAAISAVPGVASLYGAAGYDIASGQEVSPKERGINALMFAVDVLTLSSGGLGRSTVAVGRAGVATTAKIAAGTLRKLEGASRWAVSAARRGVASGASVARQALSGMGGELAYQLEGIAYRVRRQTGIDPLGRQFMVEPDAPTRRALAGVDAAERLPQGIKQLARGDQPVVVIGRSMDRVRMAAEELRSQGFNVQTWSPKNFDKLAKPMDANRSWLRYWAKEKGSPVIDIGQGSIPTRSDFYDMELRSVYENWREVNVIKWEPGF